MTPPNFSVLLLAWDDADPRVAVLGGAALPPTLPLVYQLATRQPVLAVYPHLPALPDLVVPPPPQPAAQPAALTESAIAESAVAASPAAVAPARPDAAATPGVRYLPPAGTAAPALPASRIVGLHDLTPASTARLPTVLGMPAAAPQRARPAAARSQWPVGAAPREWQAPAAPYAGASAGPPPPRPLVPNPAPRTTQSVREATDLLISGGRPGLPPPPVAPAALRRAVHPLAGDLSFDPDPELPAAHRPAIFDEAPEELGAFEANDLAAPENDLTPDAPAEAEPEPVAAPAELPPVAPAAPALLTPALDGLNFRMIQYARRAAQLMRDRTDFAVIYAPNWPAWLAALEIRNSSCRPLVLYVPALAADFTNSTERGWLLEVERMALRRARLILVPDAAVGQRLRAQYGATIGEVRVVAAADEGAVQQVLREVAK